jgi:hypothetical protein
MPDGGMLTRFRDLHRTHIIFRAGLGCPLSRWTQPREALTGIYVEWYGKQCFIYTMAMPREALTGIYVEWYGKQCFIYTMAMRGGPDLDRIGAVFWGT